MHRVLPAVHSTLEPFKKSLRPKSSALLSIRRRPAERADAASHVRAKRPAATAEQKRARHTGIGIGVSGKTESWWSTG